VQLADTFGVPLLKYIRRGKLGIFTHQGPNDRNVEIVQNFLKYFI